MYTFDKIDLQRITVSAVCAAILSTIFVFGAIAPLQAGLAPSAMIRSTH